MDSTARTHGMPPIFGRHQEFLAQEAERPGSSGGRAQRSVSPPLLCSSQARHFSVQWPSAPHRSHLGLFQKSIRGASTEPTSRTCSLRFMSLHSPLRIASVAAPEVPCADGGSVCFSGDRALNALTFATTSNGAVLGMPTKGSQWGYSSLSNACPGHLSVRISSSTPTGNSPWANHVLIFSCRMGPCSTFMSSK